MRKEFRIKDFLLIAESTKNQKYYMKSFSLTRRDETIPKYKCSLVENNIDILIK